MKKNDIIFIGVLLFIGILFLVLIYSNRTEGGSVVITIDGKEYKTMSLDKDTTFTIEAGNGEWNKFRIKDGYVDMVDASCPDKICVEHKKIHYNNETIVCLPNKVVLQITGSKESDIDAVAN